MRKHIFFFALIMSLPVFLAGQDYFDVTAVNGDVRVFDSGKRNVQAEEGMQLTTAAGVIVKDGASVELNFKGRAIALNEAKRYVLKELLTQADEEVVASSENLTDRFKDLLGFAGNNNNMMPEEDEDTLSAKSTRGAGGNFLVPVIPIETGKAEKVAGGKMFFDWQAKASVKDHYRFELYQGDQMIFSALTPQTYFQVDFSQLAMEDGQNYSWQAKVEKDDTKSSDTVPLVYSSNKIVEEILAPLKEAPYYKESDDQVRILMEAYALEEAGLFYLANDRYMNAREQFPDDDQVVQMHLAFKKRIWKEE